MSEEDSFDFQGEVIEVGEDYEPDSTDDYRPPRFYPGDIIEFGEDTEMPEWLPYQVNKMRNRADEVNDIVDVYERFLDESLTERPSEITGFLAEYGFEGQREPMEFLASLGAEKATELEEQRNLVSDNYHGQTPLGGTGLRTELPEEINEKINAELAHATSTLREVETTAATTEGGYTPPKPVREIEAEKSLGFQYREILEQEAETVDWLFDRRAHRE